jgi:DNA-binding response OmpR family regulator
VIVIEDEEGPREALAHELERANFMVARASTGKEGLEEVVRFHPDALVLDLMLPELSGFTLARAVRSLEPHRSVAIVAVSALASAALRAEAFAAGCDAFLGKPVRPAIVVEMVRRLVVGRQSPAPSSEQA